MKDALRKRYLQVQMKHLGPKKMKHVYLKNDFTNENVERKWKSLSVNLLKPWHRNQNQLQKDLVKDHINSVQLKKPKKLCLKVGEKEMLW